MEQNGPGLEYRVTWRPQGAPVEREEETVTNHTLRVMTSSVYAPYEVQVQAVNHLGAGPAPQAVVLYSGEDCKCRPRFRPAPAPQGAAAPGAENLAGVPASGPAAGQVVSVGGGRNMRKVLLVPKSPMQLSLHGESVQAAEQHGRPEAPGPICPQAAKAMRQSVPCTVPGLGCLRPSWRP